MDERSETVTVSGDSEWDGANLLTVAGRWRGCGI